MIANNTQTFNNIFDKINQYINIQDIVKNPTVFLDRVLVGGTGGIILFGSTKYKIIFALVIILYVFRKNLFVKKLIYDIIENLSSLFKRK